MTDGPGTGAGETEALRAALRAVAARIEAARRLTAPTGTAILRSVVDATVVLFDAEAASIALLDPTTGRLVFEVAAGAQGQGVVGVAIDPGEGVAGYVFSTGQPIALADVASDSRFGRATAERTGYLPRSLVAVPLADDAGVVGVLEVLDKRGGAFDLRDIELAGVFARQATVAIRSTRVERDAATLLRNVLADVGRGTRRDETEPMEDDIDRIVADATAELGDTDDVLWALADDVARLRAADPDQLELVRELLGVLIRRAERPRGGVGWRRR
ncbi:MAG TPA: GAF domain-containing protein [Candidatus Limnocylindrales bacterium]